MCARVCVCKREMLSFIHVHTADTFSQVHIPLRFVCVVCVCGRGPWMNGPLLFKCMLHSSGAAGSHTLQAAPVLDDTSWGGWGFEAFDRVLQFGFGMLDCTFVLILSIFGMSVPAWWAGELDEDDDEDDEMTMTMVIMRTGGGSFGGFWQQDWAEFVERALLPYSGWKSRLLSSRALSGLSFPLLQRGDFWALESKLHVLKLLY